MSHGWVIVDPHDVIYTDTTYMYRYNLNVPVQVLQIEYLPVPITCMDMHKVFSIPGDQKIQENILNPDVHFLKNTIRLYFYMYAFPTPPSHSQTQDRI